MKIKLSQNLSQKLILSQKMQQSLSILSLSHEELRQAIQQELLENPLLEVIENPPAKIKDSIPSSSSFRLDPFASFYDKKNTHPKTFMEDSLTETPSLKSFVLKQVELSAFPKKIKILLTVLISYLDERAYLNLNLEDLALKEKLPLNLLKEALYVLQSLEPAGLGAKNLQECLLIQLRQKKEDTDIAQLIVKNHLHNLKEKKYKTIAYDLNISFKELDRLLKTILSLEPNPGRNFSDKPTVFISPDLYIFKENGSYHIFSNQEDIPQLKLSSTYKESFGRINFKKEENKYFNEKINSASWFIQSIQQRQERVKQIAYKLIEHQKDFLEKGPDYLKPLRMQDMAEEMSVHVSTISRIVNNKYAYTHRGLISLKSFFQKGIHTHKGAQVSSQVIKRAIKKWIKEEDLSHPLSDEQICKKISKHFHISILRRSIADYRNSLGLPSSRERKKRNLNFPERSCLSVTSSV